MARRKLKPTLRAWVMSLMLVLMACETEPKYNTYYDCYFVFMANLYPTSALTRAVSSPGDFVIVKPTTERGVTHLHLTPNRGTWAATDLDLVMNTAIGNQRINYNRMGANRGLIIGSSNFFGRKAYDLQCPNCLEDYGVAKYELSWTQDGNYLECSNCKRVYQADNDDGIPVAGAKKGDKMLIQYRNVNYNEAEGRLVVSN